MGPRLVRPARPALGLLAQASRRADLRRLDLHRRLQFTSRRLQTTLDEAQADRIVLAAVSAGPELEQMAQQLWREEKPDEYFFFEVYGSAVVEHLITMHGARLCAGPSRRTLPCCPTTVRVTPIGTSPSSRGYSS